MHQHNPDLIMALAERQLRASDASAAEAEIAACVECSADLEAQRTALAILAETPAARLSATERMSLHETLRRELRLTDDPVPVTAPPQRRRRWSAAWAFGGATAVLVAVLAVAPTLRLISQYNDDAADVFAAETSEALTTTVAPVPGSDDLRVATDAGGAFDALDVAPESVPSTLAGETTTAAPSSVQDRVALDTGERPRETLTEFFQSYERSAGDPEIAIQLYAKSAGQTTNAPEPTSCVPPPNLGIPDGAMSFTVAVVLIDRVPVPVVGFAVPGSTDLILVVFDPDTCNVVFSLP